MAVNNCAAAVLLRPRRSPGRAGVVVSRGELVEIGGSFRIRRSSRGRAPGSSRSGPRTARGARLRRAIAPTPASCASTPRTSASASSEEAAPADCAARRPGHRRPRLRRLAEGSPALAGEPPVRHVAAGAASCASPATSCSAAPRPASWSGGATRSRLPGPPARPRAADGQAGARRARGDARALPRYRAALRDIPVLAMLARRRRSPRAARPRSATAGRAASSAAGRGGRRRRAAAARAPRARRRAVPGGRADALAARCARATQRSSPGRRTAASSSTPALLPTRKIEPVAAAAVRAALDG